MATVARTLLRRATVASCRPLKRLIRRFFTVLFLRKKSLSPFSPFNY
jgi:hypothetical protein